jgi:hypothetical protein
VGTPEPNAAWYVGIPRAGKTRLAHAHAVQLARASGWPVLVVDSQGVGNFSKWPHAPSADAAVAEIWRHRRSVAFLPRGGDDVERIARATLSAGHVVLLVDEAAYWLGSTRGKGGSMLRLLRAFRHAPAHVLLTTQHLSGDVPQEALSCAPQLHVFRCTAPAVLDRLEREYGLNRHVVAQLPQGQFVTINTGF